MAEKHILLVEDSPDDAKLTLKAFKKWGIANRVEIAADGVEALEYLAMKEAPAGRAQASMPAVILLDLKMPRMNGFEVLEAVRSNDKTMLVPVIIFSTSNEEVDRKRAFELGASAYIRKPVKFHEFGEVVRQLAAWLNGEGPSDGD